MPQFNQSKAIDWLSSVAESEKCSIVSLSVIFCSDDFLHRMNIEYLQHDTLTDIITFPFTDPPYIEGELYISVDRVRENATNYKVSFLSELHRVMVHGLLHLMGYRDEQEKEKKQMREKEDFYLVGASLQ
ncbi:MAG: rRNA maturation RNase YbeY [Saprospirales bacterium]|nr:MAG: rRNA maturation RNase YbeY [Saprospirales bacterium]